MAGSDSPKGTWRARLTALVAAVSASLAITTAGPVQANAALPATSPEQIGAATKTRLAKLVFRRTGQGLRIADHTSHASHSSHASHYSSRHS